jgi:hypothetical protein
MSPKKIYCAVETALSEASRDDWPTSRPISRSLLNCPRVRGIVRQHILKRGVSLTNLDDVISEVAVVMQMKMLSKLEKPSDVYFVIYRVSQLVVSNYGKKAINTAHSDEVSISTLLQDGDDEQDALERLSSEAVIDGQRDETERKIDLENAKRRFSEKLIGLGWPSDIVKERKRLGRPRKEGSVTPEMKKPPMVALTGEGAC